jgi:hypothetical protein
MFAFFSSFFRKKTYFIIMARRNVKKGNSEYLSVYNPRGRQLILAGLDKGKVLTLFKGMNRKLNVLAVPV